MLHYPNIRFIKYESPFLHDTILDCLQSIDSNYVLLCTDIISIDQKIDLKSCIRLLKRTQTYLFFLALGNQEKATLFQQKKLPRIDQKLDAYAWALYNKNGAWIIPTINMTLWEKRQVESAIAEYPSANIQKLIENLNAWIVQKKILGLLYSLPFWREVKKFD